MICINKKDTILDQASLRFSEVFYQTLFIKKYSVCKAFEVAKDEIRVSYTPTEAEKYKLLLKHNYVSKTKGNEMIHKCFPINHFNTGGLTKDEAEPIFNAIAPVDEYFVGRQQETCEILKLLSENRLVSILGPPGIGKTTLTRSL